MTRATKDFIGVSLPRADARAYVHGRGRYVDDVRLPRMLHVAYVRSPYAHARIVNIEAGAALQVPGVVGVYSAADIESICRPWTPGLSNLPPLKSVPQHALAPEIARYQGEPIVAVVAGERAIAEDAAELVDIDWESLPAYTGQADPGAATEPLVHPQLGTNRAWQMTVAGGDVDTAFAAADLVVEREFRVGRQTVVSLEPRGLIASYDPVARILTLHHSTQVPHLYKRVFAHQLGIDEHRVRVVCPDVGGGFGLKLHLYSDEMATAALSIKLGRPVKFIADRLESFVSDIHARDHRVRARVACTQDGRITAMTVHDVAMGGAYSIYPRTSTIEAVLVAVCTPLPYRIENYRADVELLYQNKVPSGHFRGVGMPVATLVGEGMVDAVAQALGRDPVEVRLQNLIPDDAYPCTTVTGQTLEGLSQQAALRRVVEMMGYAQWRERQARLRQEGRYLGIGFANVVEGNSPSPALYAAGGAPISSRDGCTLRLEVDGGVTCATGITDQGQGGRSIILQIVATTLGVPLEQIRIVSGDTDATPYGGGTWASRSTAIAGEAAHQAGTALRAKITALVARMLGCDAGALTLVDGVIIDAVTGAERMSLRELGARLHLRSTELPADADAELIVTRHYAQTAHMMLYSNCSMAVVLEVDVRTGAVGLEKIWVAEDCGRAVNPALIEEQMRGGVVQGLGSVLYEECVYDDAGQLRNGSLVDYLVPMAGETPDIEVAHLETPTRLTQLGAKGCGESGMIGIGAAVLNAVNDALQPLGVVITRTPITPARVLEALGSLRGS